jgi:hypothetical protein
MRCSCPWTSLRGVMNILEIIGAISLLVIIIGAILITVNKLFLVTMYDTESGKITGVGFFFPPSYQSEDDA